MGIGKFIAAGAALSTLAACQVMPRDQSVAQYCSDPENAFESVCKLNVEINGNRTAITETNMSLNEARDLAQGASDAALRAQGTADTALGRADAALAMRENMQCVTRTLNQTDTGTCEPGYAVMSCTQTRYTTRAGGLSVMRQITDEECKYNTRVLEMQVRCCRVAPGTGPKNVNERVVTTPQGRFPDAPVEEQQTPSPLRY